MNADQLRKLTQEGREAAKKKEQEATREQQKEHAKLEERERELIPAVVKKFQALLTQRAIDGQNTASFCLPEYMGYPSSGLATLDALQKYCRKNKLSYTCRTVPLYPADDGPDTEVPYGHGVTACGRRRYLDVTW